LHLSKTTPLDGQQFRCHYQLVAWNYRTPEANFVNTGKYK
jgi:hypothetical protein